MHIRGLVEVDSGGGWPGSIGRGVTEKPAIEVGASRPPMRGGPGAAEHLGGGGGHRASSRAHPAGTNLGRNGETESGGGPGHEKGNTAREVPGKSEGSWAGGPARGEPRRTQRGAGPAVLSEGHRAARRGSSYPGM